MGLAVKRMVERVRENWMLLRVKGGFHHWELTDMEAEESKVTYLSWIRIKIFHVVRTYTPHNGARYSMIIE